MNKSPPVNDLSDKQVQIETSNSNVSLMECQMNDEKPNCELLTSGRSESMNTSVTNQISTETKYQSNIKLKRNSFQLSENDSSASSSDTASNSTLRENQSSNQQSCPFVMAVEVEENSKPNCSSVFNTSEGFNFPAKNDDIPEEKVLPTLMPTHKLNYHKELEPLKWLFGSWRTLVACAFYPTMETLPYHEEIKFKPTMKPIIKYKSQSSHLITKEPMHSEVGFLKIKPGTNQIVLNVSHSFGVNEISEGSVVSNHLVLFSKSIDRSSFVQNASLKEISRHIFLKNGILTSQVLMETFTEPLQDHLEAKYIKVKDFS